MFILFFILLSRAYSIDGLSSKFEQIFGSLFTKNPLFNNVNGIGVFVSFSVGNGVSFLRSYSNTSFLKWICLFPFLIKRKIWPLLLLLVLAFTRSLRKKISSYQRLPFSFIIASIFFKSAWFWSLWQSRYYGCNPNAKFSSLFHVTWVIFSFFSFCF